jgi:hypothetical protein
MTPIGFFMRPLTVIPGTRKNSARYGLDYALIFINNKNRCYWDIIADYQSRESPTARSILAVKWQEYNG